MDSVYINLGKMTKNKIYILDTIENKNLSQKNIVKICHICTTNYEYLIGKYFLLKKEKEENSKQNILDELTNIIMKEKIVLMYIRENAILNAQRILVW